MKRLKYVLYGLIVLLFTGCGQTVTSTLHVPTEARPDAPGKGSTIVILPFADYSYADTIASAHRRNMTITESLTDRLTINGFAMPVQEDVFQYMVDANIISIMSYEENHSTSLDNELTGDWSNQMKDQIRDYMAEQQMHRDNRVASSPGTHGLTLNTIRKIGRQFQADYIVRGRILEFKTKQEHTWAPWKRGILPFVSGITAQTFYGFASTDDYDNWNQMLAGGTWGAIIGHNVGGPWDPDGGSSILGIDGGGTTANTIFWGAVGAGMGHLAKNSGRVDQAVVQMRIWVQEASTGNLVWTNRIEVKVSPESFLADRQYDTLFNAAIDKGVTSLVENFVTYGLN